jgi:hypothetical protein
LYWFLLFAALFFLQVVPRLTGDSPMGDEQILDDGVRVTVFFAWPLLENMDSCSRLDECEETA